MHSGDSIATVAAELHAAGVIASPFAFRVEDLILGTPLIRAGSYELRQGSSFSRVRDVLSAPPNVAVVTVNPGLTLHEVAVDVATVRGASYGDQFVKAATSANAPSPYGANNNLEGLIGSGTYIISPDMSARALVRAMVARFVKQAKADGLTPTTRVNGLDAYQLITAASIVEKEGYYPVNMPKVARVIYNRLARGGPLQMDSTVLYYFGQDGGAPTHAQEETPTPYNTYLNTGLTPTTDMYGVAFLAGRCPARSSRSVVVLHLGIEAGQDGILDDLCRAIEKRATCGVAGDWMKWRLGVAGSPIAHSLSPTLHEAGLRQAGLEGTSKRIELGEHDAADTGGIARGGIRCALSYGTTQARRVRDRGRALRGRRANAVGELAALARWCCPRREH